MINILSYLGMNLQSEVCLWCLLGLVRTIFDATLFKVNANLKQVWQMTMPVELSLPVQRILRTIVSGIMLVQCFTVYVYLASYIVLLYPVFLEERPTLVLPWLLLAAIRKLLCELTSLALGLGTCVLLGPARPPCIKFVILKFTTILPAFYMWMLVFSYYHALKVATAFKTFPAVLPLNDNDYGLELAVRRRRTKSLLGEDQLRKKLVAHYYGERSESVTNETFLRPCLDMSSRMVHSTDTSSEEAVPEPYVVKPLTMSTTGWSDIGAYEDWFGSEVMIPRDTDRILEQIVLMLLRIGAYMKKEGLESIIDSQILNSAVPASWHQRDGIDCAAMNADDTDTPPLVGSIKGYMASYLREYPQIFMKKQGNDIPQSERKITSLKTVHSYVETDDNNTGKSKLKAASPGTSREAITYELGKVSSKKKIFSDKITILEDTVDKQTSSRNLKSKQIPKTEDKKNKVSLKKQRDLDLSSQDNASKIVKNYLHGDNIPNKLNEIKSSGVMPNENKNSVSQTLLEDNKMESNGIKKTKEDTNNNFISNGIHIEEVTYSQSWNDQNNENNIIDNISNVDSYKTSDKKSNDDSNQSNISYSKQKHLIDRSYNNANSVNSLTGDVSDEDSYLKSLHSYNSYMNSNKEITLSRVSYDETYKTTYSGIKISDSNSNIGGTRIKKSIEDAYRGRADVIRLNEDKKQDFTKSQTSNENNSRKLKVHNDENLSNLEVIPSVIHTLKDNKIMNDDHNDINLNHNVSNVDDGKDYKTMEENYDQDSDQTEMSHSKRKRLKRKKVSNTVLSISSQTIEVSDEDKRNKSLHGNFLNMNTSEEVTLSRVSYDESYKTYPGIKISDSDCNIENNAPVNIKNINKIKNNNYAERETMDAVSYKDSRDRKSVETNDITSSDGKILDDVENIGPTTELSQVSDEAKHKDDEQRVKNKTSISSNISKPLMNKEYADSKISDEVNNKLSTGNKISNEVNKKEDTDCKKFDEINYKASSNIKRDETNSKDRKISDEVDSNASVNIKLLDDMRNKESVDTTLSNEVNNEDAAYRKISGEVNSKASANSKLSEDMRNKVSTGTTIFNEANKKDAAYSQISNEVNSKASTSSKFLDDMRNKVSVGTTLSNEVNNEEAAYRKISGEVDSKASANSKLSDDIRDKVSVGTTLSYEVNNEDTTGKASANSNLSDDMRNKVSIGTTVSNEVKNAENIDNNQSTGVKKYTKRKKIDEIKYEASTSRKTKDEENDIQATGGKITEQYKQNETSSSITFLSEEKIENSDDNKIMEACEITQNREATARSNSNEQNMAENSQDTKDVPAKNNIV